MMFRSSLSRLVCFVILSAIAATAAAISETRAGSAVAVVGESDLALRADAGDLRAQQSFARMLAQNKTFGLAVQYWQRAEAQSYQGACVQLARAFPNDYIVTV